MKNSQKVLVTGATGLVGVHILVDLIKRGFTDVKALYRNHGAYEIALKVAQYYQVESELKALSWTKFDLLNVQWDDDLFKDVEVVIHTAAMVSFDPLENELMKSVNEDATARLLREASKYNVAKFGFVSSVASLGRRAGENDYSEDNEWIESDLNSYYSITKHNSEKLVVEANGDSMKTFLINPGVILGPCDWNKSSGTIFRTGKKGVSFYTKGGNGFVDARDVSHNLLQIMEYGVPGERYLAVGHNVRFKDLFTDIQVAFGNKPPKFKASKLLTGIGWRLEKIVAKIASKSPVLTKHSASASHEVSRYNNEKIRQVNGVYFHSWAKSIRNAVDYFDSDNKE